MYFPPNELRYEVVGKKTGAYDFIAFHPGKSQEIVVRNVPTEISAIHTYSIDWDAITRGEKGVTVVIDKKGDGTDVDTFTVGANVNDTQPQLTTHGIAAISGQNNWYTSDVTVSLSADDATGVGVKAALITSHGKHTTA